MKGEKCFSIPALLTIIIPLHAPAVKEPQLTAGTERRRKAPPRSGAPAVKEPQLTAGTERRRKAPPRPGVPAVKETQLTAGTERRRKAPPRPGAPAVKEPQLTAVTERRRIASAPRRLRGERDAVNRRDGETQCNCFRAYTVIKM